MADSLSRFQMDRQCMVQNIQESFKTLRWQLLIPGRYKKISVTEANILSPSLQFFTIRTYPKPANNMFFLLLLLLFFVVVFFFFPQ